MNQQHSIAPRIIDRTRAEAEAKRLSGMNLIGGQLVAGGEHGMFDVFHPADCGRIAQMPKSGTPEVKAAVAAAKSAFGKWSRVPARDRGRLLAIAADRIEAALEEISELQTLETGHAIATQSRGDVNTAIDMIRMFAGVSGELKGTTVPDAANVLHFTTCEPLGVIAAILPWNGPLFSFSSKIAPALVAGNTVVVKTAETAPLAVLRCAEILQELLPPGTINILAGQGRHVGEPLCTHPDVAKVTFTGSVPVGRTIMGYVADKLIPVTLELGGKNPNIVMEDADLSIAAPGVVAGMRFARQGQSCIAGARVILHEAIYDEVIDHAVTAMNAMKVGNPFDETTDIGAIISSKQIESVRGFINSVKAYPEARILCGGAEFSQAGLEGGHFLRPTLIDGVPEDADICTKEIFGPVAVAMKVKSFEEAIRLANASDLGLAATLWTRNIGRAMQFTSQIEAGFVQVNQYSGPKANVNYGGWKTSGIGKEYTLEAMRNHFTRSKTVLINHAI